MTVKIDPKTGLRAYDGEEDAIDEVFLQGTEPQEVSSPGAGAPDGGVETAGFGLSDDGGTTPIEVPGATDGGSPPLPQLPAEDPPPF